MLQSTKFGVSTPSQPHYFQLSLTITYLLTITVMKKYDYIFHTLEYDRFAILNRILNSQLTLRTHRSDIMVEKFGQ